MRPALILFSLLAAHSLAVPMAIANPEHHSEALAPANVVERSAEVDMTEDTRVFLAKRQEIASNGQSRVV